MISDFPNKERKHRWQLLCFEGREIILVDWMFCQGVDGGSGDAGGGYAWQWKRQYQQ